MEREMIYVRMKNRIEVSEHQQITIADIAIISAKSAEEIQEIPLKIVNNQERISVIHVLEVIDAITKEIDDIIIQPIGAMETIVTLKKQPKKRTLVYFILIWLLLFVGAGLAIMNFHEDVSMNLVHQKLYQFVTGDKSERPLILQIPYSVGLGLGMILFFNHFFKWRFSKEPSPLEVEMFQYEEALDQYAKHHQDR